ncbi:hypothetical protein J4220_03405 [Candidatus Micrarchaeota archaeon]|nr:hypothetical protein [Candidatus Micrarchaeota archaeon]
MKLRSAVFGLLAIAFLLPNAFAITSVHAPAVDTNGNGVLTSLEANAIQGDGDIFVDIQPFISVDTQQSAKTAVEIAAQEAGVNAKKYDVLFKILARTQIIDGPSGGAGLTLLAYSEFAKLKPRKDLALTGAIERDGSIGGVGGVYEKALSLENTEVKLFLIPKGQAKTQGKNIVLEAEKIGVQVVEVKDFKDVVKYAFTPEGSKVDAQIFVEQPLVLDKIIPSTTLEPLKQIALNEIAALEKKLDSLQENEDNQILRESVNKSVSEAKYLVEQGYYYSAANLVFVSKISVESAQKKNEGGTDFMKKVQQLENDAKEIKFANLTIENTEWLVGAKLRYYWALNKMRGIKKSIGLESVDALQSEYAAAENWVSAAINMNEIARVTGGNTPANEQSLREVSQELIGALNESQAFVLDSEVEQHYSGAIAAFNDGDYATAFFDGLFAKGIAESQEKINSQAGSDFYKNLRTAQSLRDYNGSIWAQYYFIHSLYNEKQANRTNEFIYLSNAIKLQYLSDLLKENIPMMKLSLANQATAVLSTPAAQDEGELRISTTVAAGRNDNVILLALAALLGLLIVGLALRAIASRKALDEAGFSTVEKIEQLDKRFAQGKISAGTWEAMHERYFRQLRSAKGGKAKTVKTTKAAKATKAKGRKV